MKSLDRLPIGQRIIVAVVIITAVLIALFILGRIFGTDEAHGQQISTNPFSVCSLLRGGIQDKDAVVAVWEISLLTHIARSGDNIMALPGMQADSMARFEAGLRRAIIIDTQVRTIIDRIYRDKP